MFRAHQVIVSRTMRMLGRIGKHHSFWAMYSLRMSFWMVPESRFRSQPRSWATATYMASRIQAVGLMVMETLMLLEVDAVEERLHVVDDVDGDALASDLAEAHRVVGVVAHQRRHVEVDADPGLSLGDEVAEPAVGVGAARRTRRSAASSSAVPGTSSGRARG